MSTTLDTALEASADAKTIEFADRQLLSHHREALESSAIDQATIDGRGYFSITTSTEARALGFSNQQSYVVSEKYPALVIPHYNPAGNLATYVMRPDSPRSVDDKDKPKLSDGTRPQKIFKYEMVKGAGNVLDCHPAVLPRLGNPDIPIIFTEGAKKADSLIAKGYVAINVNGVYGWRGTNDRQGKTALADFDDIALNNRQCILCFDSDVRTNDNVKSALRRLKSFLEGRGGKVTPVLLPSNGNGKTGIDDWFNAGHSAAEFDQLVTYFEVFTPDLGTQRRKWTTEQLIETFRAWGYFFAINDMNEATEVNGELLDDTKLDIIEARLMDEDMPVGHARKAITVYANSNRYHPVKDYLRGVKWDGKDWIKALASYFNDEENVFHLWLKRWLIGAVAKVMGDGKNQNFMLVLGGPQDIGKSTFAHWVCPLDKYFLEAPLDPDDKDTRVRLMSNLVWEVGELGSVTRRTDREALKRIISMQMVDVRKSYDHFDTVKPAIVSFIGTVNPEGDGFLNDPTGNRRYAVAILKRIDFNYSQDIDVNQVWAQAYALYEQGETWKLTLDETRLRDRINVNHQQHDPLKDLIFERFDIDAGQSEWRLSGPQILNRLGLDQDNLSLTRRLAVILKGEGLTITTPLMDKDEGRKVRYWLGIRQSL